MQTDETAVRLLDALIGIDLTRSDGRVGISTLLAEIERTSPGAILQHAATIQLRSMGCDLRSADGAS